MPIASFETTISTASTLSLELRMRFGDEVAGRTGPVSGIAIAFMPDTPGIDQARSTEVWLAPASNSLRVRTGFTHSAGDLDVYDEVVGNLPSAPGTTPFTVKLVWNGAGASVLVNGAVVALPALPQMPTADSGRAPVNFRVLMGDTGGGGELFGYLDYIELLESAASLFWADLQLAREVV